MNIKAGNSGWVNWEPGIDIYTLISSVQLLSRAQLFATPWTIAPPPPSSSVHGILQARILKWVAMSFSRGSSQPRYQTHIFYVSCIAGRFFTNHLGNPISQTEESKYCKISLISGIKKERKGKRKKMS